MNTTTAGYTKNMTVPQLGHACQGRGRYLSCEMRAWISGSSRICSIVDNV